MLHSWFGWAGYLPALVVLWALGVPLCARAERLLDRPDPREVTYDEVTTLPLVYFCAPSFSLSVLLAGFLLHRLFDISKPLGIRRLQRLPGGWGIMVDDIAAATLAWVVLRWIVAIGLVS